MEVPVTVIRLAELVVNGPPATPALVPPRNRPTVSGDAPAFPVRVIGPPETVRPLVLKSWMLSAVRLEGTSTPVVTAAFACE